MRRSLLLRKFYRRISCLFFILLTTAAFLILIFFFNSLFTIKEIKIEGATKDTKVIGIENFLGKNLILINLFDSEKKLKINNPQIKEIIISKEYPSTIKISLSLYKPEAILVGNVVYFYLSDDGRILFKTKRNDFSLPVIHYYQKFNPYRFHPGDWISYKDLNIALKVIRVLTELGISVERVDIGGEDMIIFKTGKKRIFVSSIKDEKTTIYELSKIIKQFRIEGKEFESLDLRFKHPIVKF